MDEKKTQKFRQRLLEEYQKLIRSINRNRLAEEEIKLENTEDEGDLATISHNRALIQSSRE
jgi:RNA polymerase-binding transcription factor DksA